MRLLDLFSGVGAFSLGLEKSGFETVAFCEIEPYQGAVLRKHWPNVRKYEDVRALAKSTLDADGISVDAICGGFPCQDVSTANAAHGEMLGLDGDRSGLFFEIMRLVGELRPELVLLENVSQLLRNGLSRVLGAFAEIGYDAEWRAIPTSYVGSIQNRDRVWIAAYPAENGVSGFLSGLTFGPPGQGRACRQEDLPDVFADPFGGDRWPQPLIRRGDGRPPNWTHRIESCGNTLDPEIAEAIGRAYMERKRELHGS